MYPPGNAPVRIPNAVLVTTSTTAAVRETLVNAGVAQDAVLDRSQMRQQVCRIRPCACYNRSAGCRGGQHCACQDARIATAVTNRAEGRLREGHGYLAVLAGDDVTGRAAHIGRARVYGLPVIAVIAEGEPGPTVTDLLLEGVDDVIVLDGQTRVEVLPSGTDATALTGPFAVIGDVHGVIHTLRNLLTTLGFDSDGNHPDGLIPILVGDLSEKGGPVATGPHGTGRPEDSGAVAVFRLVMDWHDRGKIIVSDSNHGARLVRALVRPDTMRISPALQETLDEINAQPDAGILKERIIRFLTRTPVSLRCTGGPQGQFIVAHAAMIRGLEDRNDSEAAAVCNWVRDFVWTGPETVVVGHTTVTEPTRTREEPAADTPGVTPGEVIRIDTGAYAGGGLTAWLSQSDTFVHVPTAAADMTAAHRHTTPTGSQTPVSVCA
jgi:hypothetical protein